jgi:uncharacterized protein (TIGR02757 family)
MYTGWAFPPLTPVRFFPFAVRAHLYGMNTQGMMSKRSDLKAMLDRQVDQRNHPAFIERDPVSIPHRFVKKQDIEIAGLFAAVFSWGNRTTIIRKSMEVLDRMDQAPHDFILVHGKKELKRLTGFVHRTYNDTDLLGFVEFLHQHYTGKITPERNGSKGIPRDEISLESAFSTWLEIRDADVEKALSGFHDYFFSVAGIADRTRKHIPTPVRGSSCKRLNMYLRWMVRQDDRGVDFGLWKNISPAQLVCPLDLHVGRVARRYGLLERKYDDWQAALELTANLRKMDPDDPVKYDFALFGMGVAGE